MYLFLRFGMWANNCAAAIWCALGFALQELNMIVLAAAFVCLSLYCWAVAQQYKPEEQDND